MFFPFFEEEILHGIGDDNPVLDQLIAIRKFLHIKMQGKIGVCLESVAYILIVSIFHEQLKK